MELTEDQKELKVLDSVVDIYSIIQKPGMTVKLTHFTIVLEAYKLAKGKISKLKVKISDLESENENLRMKLESKSAFSVGQIGGNRE